MGEGAQNKLWRNPAKIKPAKTKREAEQEKNDQMFAENIISHPATQIQRQKKMGARKYFDF